MRFSVTSLLGQWGQIRFSEFLKIISSFFAQNFCTDRVDILLCSERKRGVFRPNLALWPPRSIVGVGDKHAHDSDHAECCDCICNSSGVIMLRDKQTHSQTHTTKTIPPSLHGW